MMKFLNIFTIVILTLCLNVSAHELYIVKTSDSLSNILFKLNCKKIYGRNGVLAQTLKINPKIKRTNGNKLLPGMKIYLLNSEQNKIVAATDNVQEAIVPLPKHETCVNETQNTPVKALAPNEIGIKRMPSSDFIQSFYWEVSPSISWKNLVATDENVYRLSQIHTASNTNYGANLLYGMHFEEDIDIYSRFYLESVSFIDSSTIQLLNKRFISTSFGVGALFGKKWLLELAMSDNYYLTSSSSTTADIKKVTLPEIKVSYLKDFYQYRNAKLSYVLAGSVYLPGSSPSINSKLGYGAGGALEAKLNNRSFKIGYDQNMLKAAGNSTNYQNVFWKYTWETL